MDGVLAVRFWYEKEALNLSEIDRALLANRLIESISRPPDHILKAWAEEANSRSDAYRAGKVSAIDGFVDFHSYIDNES